METAQRIVSMEAALTRLLETNTTADAKVSTQMGICTTMLAVLAALITGSASWSVWKITLLALSTAGLLLGIVFLSLGAIPRTTRTGRSIVFFGSIAGMPPETFVEAVRTVSAADYLDDLARQTHRMAEISAKKFRWIQRAQIAWYVSIIPWLITIYALTTP